MSTFLDWLAKQDSWVLIILVGAVVVALIIVIAMYVWAFARGRAVSFWPPRIEGMPAEAGDQASSPKNIVGTAGSVVSKADRSNISTKFVNAAMGSVKIYAGDLSWWARDQSVYDRLIAKSVKIQILTDSPDAPAVNLAKSAGVNVRQYPEGAPVVFRGTVCDSEAAGECRLLVVKRRAPRDALEADYNYWMKIYLGEKEHELSIISIAGSYFDDLFARGRPL